MWIDTKVPAPSKRLSKMNRFRWSPPQSLEDTIKDIRRRQEDRRILCRVRLPTGHVDEIECSHPKDAVVKLQGQFDLLQQSARTAQRLVASTGSHLSSAVAPDTLPRQAVSCPPAPRRNLPGQEVEDGLEDIENTLDGMLEKSERTNRTLDVQNRMISAVADKMERVSQQTDSQSRTLRTMRGGC